MKPVLSYAKKPTDRPDRLVKADVEAILEAGWDETAIYHTVAVAALFNFMNRLVEGLGIEYSASYAEQASKRLAEGGYLPLIEMLKHFAPNLNHSAGADLCQDQEDLAQGHSGAMAKPKPAGTGAKPPGGQRPWRVPERRAPAASAGLPDAPHRPGNFRGRLPPNGSPHRSKTELIQIGRNAL